MAEETEYLNAISCCFYVFGTLFFLWGRFIYSVLEQNKCFWICIITSFILWIFPFWILFSKMTSWTVQKKILLCPESWITAGENEWQNSQPYGSMLFMHQAYEFLHTSKFTVNYSYLEWVTTVSCVLRSPPVGPPWLVERNGQCFLPGTDGVFALTDGHWMGLS